ncbi:MAG: class I SAM-dependent methyltransferase [Terriglobales bacterium]
MERSSLRANLLFALTFLKHPVMLGSIIPSSKALVKRLAAQIDWANTRVLVEYGPGVGTITTEMLAHLRPDGVLIGIDFNRDFADYLRRSVNDPRLKVAHASAADVEKVMESFGVDGADCILSGIPYSTLAPELRGQILESSRRVLRPGGTFLVYQFTRAVRPQLCEVFGEVSEDFEPRNILPARIYCCSR